MANKKIGRQYMYCYSEYLVKNSTMSAITIILIFQFVVIFGLFDYVFPMLGYL